jgi:glyoxylase-like metal-dependent hydrolase (beta-lactamase superfamily II)
LFLEKGLGTDISSVRLLKRGSQMQVSGFSVPFPSEWGRGESTNAYILKGKMTALVDAGLDSPNNREYIKGQLKKLSSWKVDLLLITHGHIDHFGLASYIQGETGAEIYIHEDDSPALKNYRKALTWLDEVYALAIEGGFSDIDLREARIRQSVALDIMGVPKDFKTFRKLELDMGDQKLSTIHLPGHTPGSVGYVLGEIVFSGDVALDGSTVVGDLRGELESIQKLKTFREVYTGHRRTPINAMDLEALEAHIAQRLEEVLRVTREGKTLREIVSAIYPASMMLEENFIRKIIPIRQVVSYLRYLEEEGYIVKNGAIWRSFKEHL